MTLAADSKNCLENFLHGFLTHGAFSVDNLRPLLPALAFFFAYLATSRLYFSPLRGIPGPWYAKISEIWYFYIFVRYRRVRTIDTLFEKYGPVVRVSPNRVIFLDVPTYKFVYGPVAKVEKTSLYKVFTIAGRDHMFTMLDHASHTTRRRSASSHYTFSNLSLFEPEFHAATLDIIDFMSAIPTRQYLDTLVLFRHYLIDVNCVHLFDYKSTSLHVYSEHVLNGGSPDRMSTAINDFPRSGILSSLFPKWLWAGLSCIPIPRWREMVAAGDVLFEFANARVRESLMSSGEDDEGETVKGGRKSLVSRMLLQNRRGSELISEEDIVAETTGHIIAGTDTTSTTLSFLLYELSRRKDVLQKLQEEIDTCMVDTRTIPDNRTLRELPYLNAIINEGLRIYSAQPSPLDRIVPPSKDSFRVLGHILPTGTIVAAQAWSIHRRPDVFPNPEKFEPDRWVVGKTSSPHDHSSDDAFAGNDDDESDALAKMKAHMFPFGYGPRICLGNNMVMIVLRIVLASVVKNFDVIAAPETNDESMDILDNNLIFPVGGECKLRFLPRLR